MSLASLLVMEGSRSARSGVQIVLALCCWSLCVPRASGLIVEGRQVPILMEAGDGPSVSYLVVDFGGANPPGRSYTFAYYYTAPKTGQDLLAELDAASEQLQIEYLDFGSLGLFVSSMTVDEDTDTPDFNVDQRYWSYWQSDVKPFSDAPLVWKGSEIGSGDRQLVNGSVDGWYASTGEIPPTMQLGIYQSDLNGDGCVDAADAGALFADWGLQTSPADFNLDLVVDAADAGVMFAQWSCSVVIARTVPEPAVAHWLLVALALGGRAILAQHARWGGTLVRKAGE